jgi:MFS family permease
MNYMMAFYSGLL